MFPLSSGNATVHIGGFFNFYHHAIRGGQKVKEINPQIGIMFSEAMRFALEKINNATRNETSYLHGFKLKARITDATVLNELKEYILRGYISGVNFAVGPFLSKDASELAFLGKALRYPLVSYYASFDTMEQREQSFSFAVSQLTVFVYLHCWISFKSLNGRTFR